MSHEISQDETVPTTPHGTTEIDFDLDGTRTVAQPHPVELDTAPPRAEPTANHVALPENYALQEFTILKLLGTGGFGITYLARDNNLQCEVAIKEYLPNDLAVRTSGQTVVPRSESFTLGYRQGLDRFLMEARVLAGFRHPNIVRVTRFFEANHTAYMVMDYERGESLRSWLTEHGAPDEAALRRMFLPLLDGLDVVHKAGIVHRDIKPANIYLRDGDGSLVLLDFGAARQTTGASSRSLTSIVTPGYAPFEQYHTRGAQGPWTDLYALGGVLYWLVTGEKPAEAPSRIKDDVLKPAVEAGAGRYSKEFLAAIDWALAVDEHRRPQSVGEFRAVLNGEAALPVYEPAVAVPPAPTSAAAKPAKSASKLVLASAALAVLIGVAAVMLLPKSTPSAGALTAAPQAAAVPAPNEPQASDKQAEVKVKAATKPTAAVPTAAKKEAAAAGSAVLQFEIAPPGERAEIQVDGKKIGTAPPLKEFKLPPGKHKVEIYGSKPPNVYHFWLDLKADEKKKLWAKFADI